MECFGFEALQLRLQAFPSEEKKQISSWLAELVQFGGDDPEFYTGLVLAEQNRRRRQQEKERNMPVWARSTGCNTSVLKRFRDDGEGDGPRVRL